LAGPPPLATGIPTFLDTNRDGVISEAERQAFVEARKEARGGPPDWDSDGDGTINDAERAAAVAILQAKVDEKRSQLFAAIAGDDEVLTLDEFAALHPFANVPLPTIQRLFDLLDADGNGEVTFEEFLAGINRVPAAPPNGGPPSPPSS